MSTYVDGRTGTVLELKPMDIVAYRGQLFGLAWPFVHPTNLCIQIATGSCWVHAGVIVRGRLQGSARVRTLVSDATEDGVDVRPLSADVRRGHRVGVLRPPGEYHVDEAALATFVWMKWGAAVLGTRKLLASAWAEFGGRSRELGLEELPDDSIGSEWSRILAYRFVVHPSGGRFDPCPHRIGCFTSPADLAKRSLLRWVTEDLRLRGPAVAPSRAVMRHGTWGAQ